MQCPNVSIENALILLGIYLVNMLVEYYLGKTERIKSGSIFELCLTMGVLCLTFLTRKKEIKND